MTPVKLNQAVSNGIFIQGLTAVHAEITNAQASGNKTITSYSIDVSPFGSSNTASFTSNALDSSGTFTARFTVSDSGGMVSVTGQSFTVETYWDPSVEATFVRCDSDMTDNPLGSYIKYKATARYYVVDGNSIQSIQFTTSSLTRSITADNAWHLIDNYTQPANVRREYTLSITDKFKTISTVSEIPSANYAIYLNDDGTAIAFGGASEHINSVEVAPGRTLYVPTKIDAGEVEYDTLVQSSSRTIKHDIQALADFGDALDDLTPVTFIYDGDENETQHIGLIYEDTVGVLPAICTPEGQNKAISYIELVPILLKEIQRLRSRIADAEAALADLSGG